MKIGSTNYWEEVLQRRLQISLELVCKGQVQFYPPSTIDAIDIINPKPSER